MNYFLHPLKILASKFRKSDLIIIGIVFVLEIILWLPFGFRNNGLIEEWTFIRNFDHGQIWTPGIPANRILDTIAFWLGYVFTPNSFVGMTVMLYALLLGQGLAYYLFFRQLTNNPSIALTAAILGLIYPAGTGIFYIRLLNYQVLPLFYFLAAYLLLRYWQQPSRVKLLTMWGALLVSIWVTELAIPTICLTPLFLLYQEKRLTKRLFKVSGLWYLPLIGSLLTWLYLYLTDKMGYLEGMANDNTDYTFRDNLTEIVKAMVRAYRRAYYDGWNEGLHNVNLWFLALAIGFAGIVFGFVFSQLRQSNALSNRKVYLLWLVVSLGLFLIGILPFLLAPNYRHTTDRFFAMASPWAALSVALTLYLLTTGFSTKARRYIFPAMASLIIVWAMQYAFQQHQNAIRFSMVERDILTQIATTVPHLNNQVIVVYDESGHLTTNEYVFGMSVTYMHLRDALSYLYEKPVQVYTCAGLFYRCEFDRDQFYYYYHLTDDQLVAQVPIQQVIAFRYCYSTSLIEQIPSQLALEPLGDSYNPRAIIQPDQAPPRRLANLFHDWFIDVDTPLFTPLMGDRFEFDSEPPGCGWSYVQGNGVWSTSDTSTLLYDLNSANYHIRFRVLYVLQPEILSSLKLYVNNTAVPLTQSLDADGAILFDGVIPQAATPTNQESSELKFVVDHVVSPESLGLNTDTRRLGLLFDWVQITPVSG
ncbi:MAG: hypothetical protein HY862_08020 [Chloroflexi bacterium]|nr:hypothetical protein [Chloroflexota bacterium]